MRERTVFFTLYLCDLVVTFFPYFVPVNGNRLG